MKYLVCLKYESSKCSYSFDSSSFNEKRVLIDYYRSLRTVGFSTLRNFLQLSVMYLRDEVAHALSQSLSYCIMCTSTAVTSSIIHLPSWSRDGFFCFTCTCSFTNSLSIHLNITQFIRLQDQKFDKLVIDRTNAKDFERSFKFKKKSDDIEHNPSNNQAASTPSPTLDDPPRLSGSNLSAEEIEKS